MCPDVEGCERKGDDSGDKGGPRAIGDLHSGLLARNCGVRYRNGPVRRADVEAREKGEAEKMKASFQNSVAAKYLKTASEEMKRKVSAEREDDCEMRRERWQAQCELKPRNAEEARTYAVSHHALCPHLTCLRGSRPISIRSLEHWRRRWPNGLPECACGLR